MTAVKNQQKPKILVLVKMDKKAARVLAASKDLAHKLGGTLRIMHVKATSDAVQTENQLTAKKVLYEDYRATQKQLEELLAQTDMPKNYDLGYGNVKNYILDGIQNEKPQVIVMGQREPKLLGLLGDGLIDAVLNDYNASVYIVNSAKTQTKAKTPTISIFNGNESSDFGLFGPVIAHEAHTINYLSIDKKEANSQTEGKNHYVFTDDAKALNNLVAFTKKIDSQLFCVPKGMDKNFPKNLVHKLKTDVLMVR